MGGESILVGTDTSSFESFRRQLFVFIGDHVNAEREFIDVGSLAAEIEDADFGVWNTTVEARFGIRLVKALSASGLGFVRVSSLPVDVRALDARSPQ